MGQKLGDMPLLVGAAPHLTQRRQVYLRTKWHLDPSSRMTTIDMGQKLGGAVPFFLGDWVPIEHIVACAEAYLQTKWHLSLSSRLATTDIARKLGAVSF